MDGPVVVCIWRCWGCMRVCDSNSSSNSNSSNTNSNSNSKPRSQSTSSFKCRLLSKPHYVHACAPEHRCSSSPTASVHARFRQNALPRCPAAPPLFCPSAPLPSPPGCGGACQRLAWQEIHTSQNTHTHTHTPIHTHTHTHTGAVRLGASWSGSSST